MAFAAERLAGRFWIDKDHRTPFLLPSSTAPVAAAGVLVVAVNVGLVVVAGAAAIVAAPALKAHRSVAVSAAGAAGLALALSGQLSTTSVVVAAVAIGVAARLAEGASRVLPAGLTEMLLWIAAAGVWWAVPDTEPILVVLGAATAMAAARALSMASGTPRRHPPYEGVGALAGLVAWAAVAGGAGEAAPIIAGYACLGVIVVAPVMARLRRRLRTGPTVSDWLVLGSVQVVIAVAASRGLSRLTPTGAAAGALLMLAAAALVLAGVSRRHPAGESAPRS